MKIYGIYDTKNSEQCMRIGTLQEVVRFLDLTAKEIGRAIKSNNLIRNQYKLCYLCSE